MLRPSLLVAGLCLLLAGCGKTDQPAPPAGSPANAAAPAAQPPPPAAASQPALPAAPVSAAPVTAAPAPAPAVDATAALPALTQALRKYSAEKQRVPTSLTEVVGAGYIQALPQPPPGKKFAIDPRRVEVILVNR